MRVGFIILGAAIAFCLLVFVSPMSFLGVTCFAIGVRGGGCIPSGVYYGAWFLAVGTIGFGLLPLFGSTAARQRNIGGDDAKFDTQKWQALVDLDPEIRLVATNIRHMYGSKYEAMLASKYLFLNDKQYLKAAADSIAAIANKDKEEEAHNKRFPESGEIGNTKFERFGNNKYTIMSGRHYGKKFPSYGELESFVRDSA